MQHHCHKLKEVAEHAAIHIFCIDLGRIGLGYPILSDTRFASLRVDANFFLAQVVFGFVTDLSLDSFGSRSDRQFKRKEMIFFFFYFFLTKEPSIWQLMSVYVLMFVPKNDKINTRDIIVRLLFYNCIKI